MANMAASFQALGLQQAADDARDAPPTAEDNTDEFFDAADLKGESTHFLFLTSPITNSVSSQILDSGASSHLFATSTFF